MNKITTCLWFDDNAEEALEFYSSIFKDLKVGRVLRYDEASAKVSGRPEGSVLTAEFELFGQNFIAMNGGPIFKFTEAVSFIVNCENQEEVDYFWEKLSAVPESEQCGWLKDKFGLSWQITPRILDKMLNDSDTEKSGRVMQAMLQMKKIDIKKLEDAYNQK